MKTVALRFAEYFAPVEGTIHAHEAIIKENGFVWYGKMGTPLSQSVINTILKQDMPRILLIHSGGLERYWAYVEDISKEEPDKTEYPAYYHNKNDKINTWFKIIRFDRASKNILSACKVASSGSILSEASKRSMSPYFIIEAPDD